MNRVNNDGCSESNSMILYTVKLLKVDATLKNGTSYGKRGDRTVLSQGIYKSQIRLLFCFMIYSVDCQCPWGKLSTIQEQSSSLLDNGS